MKNSRPRAFFDPAKVVGSGTMLRSRLPSCFVARFVQISRCVSPRELILTKSHITAVCATEKGSRRMIKKVDIKRFEDDTANVAWLENNKDLSARSLKQEPAK